jgi:transposase
MLDSIDFQPMYEAYHSGGKAPHRPELMLGIALVEILAGNSSPASWHRNARTRDQCKYVGQGIRPSRTSCYDFRDRCGKFISQISEQIVQTAITDGAVDPTQAALDGTYTRAAASRHRAMNLGQLERRVERLEEAIELLDTPSPVIRDAKDIQNLRESAYIPMWIGATPTGRQRQIEQYKLARSVLSDRIARNLERAKRYQSDPTKMIISVWDVDSVIGRDKEKVLCPLYNSQFMVASGTDIILSYDVFAQCTDAGTLAPMIDRTQAVVAVA